jgi:hypothetical protein
LKKALKRLKPKIEKDAKKAKAQYTNGPILREDIGKKLEILGLAHLDH